MVRLGDFAPRLMLGDLFSVVFSLQIQWWPM
jgi:hypothetical protein